jgi:hypothetical protein
VPEFYHHLVLCDGCSLPMDESPESQKDWDVLTTTLRCPSTPECPGHVVRTQIFCLDCQQKGKNSDHSQANNPSPGTQSQYRV